MSAALHFSQSYAEAREKFLAAVEAAGLDNEPHVHPLLGRDGERLAMDVVRQGAAPGAAKKLLILSSACHGVEGYCGSGVQIALLRDPSWHAAVKAAGVAVLYIHALNPHGFSFWRRVTQEGVDLNRNFLDFRHHQPLPANPGYDEIAAAVVPAHWPPSEADEAVLKDYAARHGERGLQAAMSGGQYAYEQGLFYGGRAPTWSNVTLRHVIEDHGRGAEDIAWIDLHTGLGPSGLGELIWAGRDDAAAIARARQWWGQKVTSIYDGSSTSALLQGLMWGAIFDACPEARYTGVALEYGTVPWSEVTQSLRGDHWLEAHPEAPAELAAQIKQRIRDAFYVDTDEWKQRIVEQAQDTARQALRGLGSPA